MIRCTTYSSTVKLIIATPADEEQASLLKIMCIEVDNHRPQATMQTQNNS
jgi:hypothetical protein